MKRDRRFVLRLLLRYGTVFLGVLAICAAILWLPRSCGGLVWAAAPAPAASPWAAG